MKISEYAEEVLKEHEGLRLKAYRCSSGVLTIGYGHTRNVKMGDVIDKDTAERFFVEDVEAVERLVDREPFAKDLSQGQYDALVSFLFNVKYSSYQTSTLRRKIINNVNDVTIPDEFRRWVYGTDPVTKKKIKLPGLVKRREWEASMYEDL
ncbi:MAG: lysozyme [Bacteroidaceae bacterium]|nr:lysozyme [Bacteroidaceae bacterium]MBQ8543517.1 lysozyme [Bacteroidaceae bacterium]